MNAFGVGPLNACRVLDCLGRQSGDLGEPIIAALVVNSKNGRCSKGFEKKFGVEDDEAERQRLYEFWANRDQEPELPAVAGASLELRAARFVGVEVRPRQAAFRRNVFLACEGRCVISGCAVLKALDAAHKHGHDWRKEHNGADDGYVLRKDLHALYDGGLLRITEEGFVELDASIGEHYAEFRGRAVWRC